MIAPRPRLKPLLICACLLLATAGCRSGPSVRHDLRAGTDFSRYQTYQIAETEPLEAEYPTIYTDLVDERLREALHAELQQQGLKPAEPGELRVLVQLQVRSELRARGGTGIGLGFGFGSGRVGTGVGIGTGTRSADEEILVDLVVSLVEAESGRLLWQGVAENGLGETRRRSAEEVRRVVDRLFDQPPFVD